MFKRSFLLIMCLVLFLLPVPGLCDVSPKLNVLSMEDVSDPAFGQHFYLLLCQDTWENHDKLGNTDGIVLVTLDTYAHRVMLTSIIRDALVVRPDGVVGRINYIPKNYSPQALCDVLSTHLGVRVEKYILFNFSQIQSIIDFLGGVDLTVTSAEASYLMRYAIPKTSTVPQMTGTGTYRFNGHAAVIYMRIRKAGGGGDFMRTQRVRTVLSTLADQCRAISYEEARSLVDNVLENSTSTNMSLEEMVQAMEYAYTLRSCTVEELRIPQDGDYKPSNYAGMACQEVDWKASREAFQDYLHNSFLVVDEDEDE